MFFCFFLRATTAPQETAPCRCWPRRALVSPWFGRAARCRPQHRPQERQQHMAEARRKGRPLADEPVQAVCGIGVSAGAAHTHQPRARLVRRPTAQRAAGRTDRHRALLQAHWKNNAMKCMPFRGVQNLDHFNALQKGHTFNALVFPVRPVNTLRPSHVLPIFAQRMSTLELRIRYVNH